MANRYVNGHKVKVESKRFISSRKSNKIKFSIKIITKMIPMFEARSVDAAEKCEESGGCNLARMCSEIAALLERYRLCRAKTFDPAACFALAVAAPISHIDRGKNP